MVNYSFWKGYAAGWLTWFLIAIGSMVALAANKEESAEGDGE